MALLRALIAIFILAIGAAAPAAVHAQATTALSLQYEAQAPSLFQYPASTPSIISTRTHVTVGAGAYRIEIDAPSGGALVPGVYEGATRYPFNPPGPGLDLVNGSYGCNVSTGRFVVLESAFDGDQLIRLAIDFEHHCEGGPFATYGELRVNSSVPITANRAPGWTMPDPFAFRTRSFVTPGAEVLSDVGTIYGINAPAPISIDGGQYSINGGPFTSVAGTVNNRDKVRVLATAPGAPSSSATANLNVGGRIVPFTVSTYSVGSPVSAIWLQGTGDWVFGTRTLLAYAPDWNIVASGNRTRFSWSMAAGGENWSLGLAPGIAGPWSVGSYEDAARTPFAGNAPGVEFTGNGRGCNTIAGRFTVLEATYNADGTLASFAADFEQRCDGGAPLYGEVRFNSPVPFTFERPADWAQPDPFGFRGRDEVAAGTVAVSNAVGIYGINADAPISIANGEYRINGGTWTSAPGTVANRSHVEVRTTASTTAGQTVTATLSVGGVVANFAVRTYAPGDVMSALYFVSSPGDYIGGGQELTGIPPLWTVQGSGSSVYVSFSISGANGAWYYLDIAAPPGAPLAVGAYENAARAAFRGTSPGLDFNGQGRGCNMIAGRFVVRDIAWNGNTLARFAADFEQHCEITGAPLYGEIRFNSDIPISALAPAGTTTPNPFAFNALQSILPATVVESNLATIYGINAPSPISIVGGEYSVDGGAWTSAAGTVNNLAHVKVRLTSGATPGATANATLTVGGQSATFSVRTYAAGDPLTAIYYRSTPGDWVGKGATVQGMSPQWTISASGASSSGINFSITGPGGAWYYLTLAAPPNGILDLGAYEEAARAAFRGTSPGVDFSGNGAGCNAILGRFAVLDIAWSGSTLTRFAADFQQSCDGGPLLYGEIRYQSPVPLTVLKPAGSTTPDPFAFNPRAGVQPGTVAVSNAITLYGVNAPVPVAISGGEYSVNGGPFTSSSGTASPLDRITVRAVAQPISGASSVATLTAGGASASFTVTTYVPGAPVSGFAFRSSPGDYIGGGNAAQLDAPPNLVSVSNNFANGLSFSITTTGGGWWYLDLAGPSSTRLAPGAYIGAARFPFQASGQPGLSLTGNGAGCNQVAGRFIVHEIAYNGDGSVARFAADFEQHCEISGPPLYGEIRYNSAIPFSRTQSVANKRRVRDLDGDGNADLLWRGPSSAYGTWLMNGVDARAYSQVIDPGTGLDVLAAGDFDGDGRYDFVGRYPDGRIAAWMLNGTSIRGAATLLGAGSGWRPVLSADFDGDFKGDLLWRSDAGAYAVWLMNGPGATAYGTLFGGATGNRVTHAGDMNGDGRADLVGVGADGFVHVWLMNGAAASSDTALVGVGTGWTPVALADVSGDGRADLVLQHADGRFRVLVMNGATIVSTLDIGAPGNGWKVVATGDLDGDGRADLVLQHSDGSVAAWLMYGTQITPAILVGSGSGWSVVGSDDYDGDGKADLLWRHQDGSHAIWLMNGLSPRSYKVILGAGTGWSVIP